MKTLKVLVMFIFVSLSLVSCGKEDQQTNTNSGSNIPTAQTPTQKPYTEILDNLKDVYKNSDQFNSCMSQVTTTCVNQAMQQEAVNQNDSDLCNEMPEDYMKKICKEGIIIEQAKKAGNVKLCDKIDNDKNNCVNQVAINLATTKKNVNYCDLLDTIKNQKTNSGAALDPILLQSINSMKSMCINNTLMMIVTKKEEITLCNKIPDSIIKDNCTKMLKTRFESVLPVSK